MLKGKRKSMERTKSIGTERTTGGSGCSLRAYFEISPGGIRRSVMVCVCLVSIPIYDTISNITIDSVIPRHGFIQPTHTPSSRVNPYIGMLRKLKVERPKREGGRLERRRRR